MTTAAQLVERSAGLIDLVVRSQPFADTYRFGASVTLNAAFAAPTAMFDVPRNAQFVSRTLQLQRRGKIAERTPNLTRATFNLNDYASATVPGDSVISFISVALGSGGLFLPYGPILVVPPPGFFSSGRRVLNLVGTAPNVAAGTDNLPPSGSMNFVFPKFANHVQIFNTGANPLFVSFDEGLPEFEIPSAGTNFLNFQEAGVQQVFIRASGGTSAFKVAASIVNGIQA